MIMDTKQQARALMMRHHKMIKNRQQSMLGRAASEIGMDINASEHWTAIQGKPFFGAVKSYDRSHAASS
jgi:hypothetical protein